MSSAAPFDKKYWRIMQAYGPYGKNGVWENPFHNGVDVYLPEGTPLYAVTEGFVTWNSNWTLPGKPRGWAVILKDASGVPYTYGHVSKVYNVGRVAAGTLIAASGGVPGHAGAGYSTGPHIHFSIGPEIKTIDPTPFLNTVFDHVPLNPARKPMTSDEARTEADKWYIIVLNRVPENVDAREYWAAKILKADGAGNLVTIWEEFLANAKPELEKRRIKEPWLTRV